MALKYKVFQHSYIGFNGTSTLFYGDLRFRQWGPPAPAFLELRRALRAIFSAIGCLLLYGDIRQFSLGRRVRHFGEASRA